VEQAVKVELEPVGKQILVIEDNQADVELLRYFLRPGPEAPEMIVASDGVEAMCMLRGQGPYDKPVRPSLILLDLNLPRKDGREVLTELKEDPQLQHIPVVVLSTSDAAVDISHAYALHANCYLQKPADVDEFERTVRGIEDFWLTLVKLPIGSNGRPSR
jgi:CheY-like chemotaxis protein